MANPNWVPGVSANPSGRETAAARRARIDAIVARWTQPFGGVSVLSPAELALASTAAALSLERPRKRADMLTQANTVARLLALAGLATRRTRPREVVEPEEPPEDRLAEFRAKIDAALAAHPPRGGDAA
jgi:hypothetical protein